MTESTIGKKTCNRCDSNMLWSYSAYYAQCNKCGNVQEFST